MAWIETFKCDGDNCSSVKSETNHWWIADVGYASTHGKGFDIPVFNVRPWSEPSKDPGLRHYCSQNCALKAFDQWMQKGGEI